MSNTRKLYRCSKCGSLTRWKIINHRSNVTKDSAIGYVWCKACWKHHTRPAGAGGRSGVVSSKAHKVDPHIRSLVIAMLDARYVSRYSDGRPDEPFGEEVWQDICKDTSPSGARFDVGTPEQVVSEALAVRDAFIDQIAQGEGSVSKAWLRKQKSKR